jgi:hypothetical protein
MDSNKPAFPVSVNNGLNGLTKRQFISAMALSGLLSQFGKEGLTKDEWKAVIVDSVKAADDLLKELDKHLEP